MLGVPAALLERWQKFQGTDDGMPSTDPHEQVIRSGVISKTKRGRATLYIYGPIVDEEMRVFFAECFSDPQYVSGLQIRAALDGFDGDQLDVRMNCPGGYVYEASVIHSAFAEEVACGCEVNFLIDGIAASAATTIMLSGSSIRMARMSELFIHPAWSICIGNRFEMAVAAKDLRRTDRAAIRLYAERMGGDETEATALMNASPDSLYGRGSWISASDAIKLGLADGYIAADKPKAGPGDDDPDDTDDPDDADDQDTDADDTDQADDSDQMADDDEADDQDDDDDDDDEKMPKPGNRRRVRRQFAKRRAAALTALVGSM